MKVTTRARRDYEKKSPGGLGNRRRRRSEPGRVLSLLLRKQDLLKIARGGVCRPVGIHAALQQRRGGGAAVSAARGAAVSAARVTPCATHLPLHSFLYDISSNIYSSMPLRYSMYIFFFFLLFSIAEIKSLLIPVTAMPVHYYCLRLLHFLIEKQ
jgi:hypothetical protein